MNDKALEYAFGLFQQDGYTGTLDEYKELIGKDQEALNYSFDLFSNDGYSGNKDQFSALVMPGKTEPMAPGVAVEETAAPVIKPENTESELERGFLGFNEIARAVREGSKSGLSRAAAAGETLTIFSKLGDAEKYEYDDFVNVVNKYNEESNIAEFEKWSNSYDQYKEAGNNAIMSTLLATKDEGIAGFSGVLVQSLAGLLSPESIGAAGTLGAAGAGVGSVIPGIGTAIVGVGSGMAGANAMSETMITFASNIQEELTKKNLEFTGANVQALMQDEEAASNIRNKSLARGLTIGAIEGVFTALGGKAFSSTARAVKGATGSAKISKLAGAGSAGATEMAGGSLGEAAGLTVEGKPLDAKEIIVEGVAGIGGAPVSIATKAPGLLKNTEYIINGSKVNYNLAKEIVDGADVTALAGMKIQVKNDNEFKSYAQTRQQDEILKSQIDTRITDAQDRADVFELEKELKQFQNKDTETAKIRAKEIKQEIADISAKYKRVGRRTAESKALETQKLSVQDKAVQRIKEQSLDPENKIGKTVSFAETAAEQIRLQEPTIVNNTKDFLNALKADNVELDSEQLSQVSQNRVGGVAINGKIYINKEVAAKTGQINVGAHEILHPIINARIKNQPQFVEEFKQKLTKNQRNQMERLLTDRGYTGNKRAQEYFTVFSDAVRDKEFSLNDSILQKIGNVILNILRPLGFANVSFEDAQGVLNFMREYNRSINKGKLTKTALSAIGDISDIGARGAQTSQTFTPEQDKALQADVLSYKQKLEEQEALNKKFNKDVVTAPVQRAQNELKVKLNPLIQKIVNDRTKALYDKIPLEQKRNVPRENYQITLENNIFNLVSEYKGRQPLEKFLVNRSYLRANSLATELGIEQQIKVPIDRLTDDGAPVIQIESNYTDNQTMLEIRKAEKERLENLVDPTDILGEDKAKEYYKIAAENVAAGNLKGAVLATAEDVAPEITSELFGIKLNAYLGINKQGKRTSVNFSGDKTKAQQLIYDNADLFITIMPEGAILEGDAASKNLIGTGVRIPRKLQQAFYDQQERIGIGAGLEPFKLKPNITKKDFLNSFGINTDGTFQTLANGSPKAIAMIGFARLTGRLMTNTAARADMSKRVETGEYTPAEIQDLSAGTSSAQLSLKNQIAEDQSQSSTHDSKRIDDFANKIIPGLKSIAKQFGYNFDNEPILNTNKSQKDQKFYIERLTKFLDIQDDFLNFMPVVAKQFKGLVNAVVGMNYREDATGVDFLLSKIKGLYYENNQPVTDINLIEDIISRNRADYRDKNNFYTSEGNTANYSDFTNEQINRVKQLIEAAKNEQKLKGNETSPNNAYTIKKAKEKLMPIVPDAIAIKVLKDLSKNNPLNNELAKLYISLMRDFVASHPNKRQAVKSIMAMLTANRNTVNAFRSLSSVEKVIFDPKVETEYHFEHDDSMAIVIQKIFRQILDPNLPIKFESTASLVPVEIAQKRDSKAETKISDKQTFYGVIAAAKNDNPNLKEIKLNYKGEPSVQLSLANTFYDKIEANKAAYKKIKKEDRFDMLETVTRQMFPESANQPRGSYESLTPEQRLEVFNRMQENGMIAPGIQFSLAKDLAEKISNKSEIDATAEISEKKARLLGKNKGKWKFFIPPSADDFAGLMYYMVGKGKKGNEDLAWFKQNLFDPFAKGINEFSTYRQFTMNQFRRMKKLLRGKNVKLKATNSTGFTNEVAVRVYVWATNGHEVPGLSETEVKEMVNIVSSDPSLRNFAGQIINLTNFAETPAPEKSWDSGTLTTDILDYLNTSSREKFLEEYLSNAEEIFGKFGQSGGIEGETANRLRAAFGDNYVEALSDVLYRMKTGRRRITGSNRLTNQFVNWVNDSVGAIMFFNTRSALLQQLSFVNFINFGDNNPLAASRAFINQPQFWSDYVSLFNSDFLKERRSGLKTDVNADEIARAAEEGRNPIRAVIASLLKKGFLPTQIADSHAIALGGASFYRNRLNKYVKEGMAQEDASKQAFVDFQEIAEETQQSSRPDRISMQQASGLGRLILAFANTPMQYARLTKKAALDLINRRGDWKTNLSKLMYYGAVQNVIFSSLQTALFALAFDDDEDDETTRNRYFRIANGTADGLLRGLGFGGAAVAAGKNMVLEGIRQSKLARPDYEEVAYEALKLSPPISSKIEKLASAGRMFTYRNTREKMKTAGFTLDNPVFESAGKIISATTNLPADRVIRKLDNLSTPVRQDVETWQAVSLALGYSKWDVGLIESKAKKPQTSTTGLKKVKRKKLERKKLN